ncbi:MAG TPA: sigma-70 family RNA polymerase sigma factor [Gemmataceae bacterium]|jgi:RNA polymerase sigma-70 factor (ECF subfamily)|nr:sigma-70 family RNA polymerase sigma factor [Gemmataceae bacterium]
MTTPGSFAEPDSFAELVRRVRAGDAVAATELVRRYEPSIRRVIRVRLGGRVGAMFDSMDVCQSVLGSFFLRAAAGQYALDTPTDLMKLLTVMARHKLAFQVRKQRAQKRDYTRDLPADQAPEQPASDPTPSRQIEARDLLSEMNRRLTDEERQIVRMRTEGHDWAAIADRLDGSAEALRKKHARALDRVARELGLENA